jgi:hypothetical protein
MEFVLNFNSAEVLDFLTRRVINRKDQTDDGIRKGKKPNLLYIVIVLGMDFFRMSIDSLVKYRPYTTQHIL